MRVNYQTCLSGNRCVLVPYRPEHVETYHQWMKDPDLLDATGSEPLSFDEEVSMQQSWRDDPNKCTFIVLTREGCVGDNMNSRWLHSHHEITGERTCEDDPGFVQRNLGSMVGDVNLFLSEEDDDEEEDAFGPNPVPKSSAEPRQMHAELDIMIAVNSFRGMGIGTEAARMMMLYGAVTLGIRRYFVKIKEDNVASRTMFEKKMGFVECNYAECFREVELEFKRDTAEKMADAVRALLGMEMAGWTCSLGSDPPDDETNLRN